jgi:phospho-2-dehydro-3-deoxyheptonate aldolase
MAIFMPDPVPDRSVLLKVPLPCPALLTLERPRRDAQVASVPAARRRLEEILSQRVAGNHRIVGAMVERDRVGGGRSILKDRRSMRWGRSVTDPLIGWKTTERILCETERLLSRRGARVSGRI